MEKKISVILVERNEDECALMADYLTACGDFSVVCTPHDGDQALRDIRSHRVQVVVMNIVLPGLDGLGLLEQIMAQDAPPKVIILSQWTRDDVIRDALAAGASYFMAKPCSYASLAERIRAAARCAGESAFSSAEECDQLVGRVLRELGLGPATKGMELARSAVMLAVRDPSVLRAMKKRIYEPLARKYGGSADSVEHALRYTITKAWTDGDPGYQRMLFGSTVCGRSGKPTNAEFLAVVAEWIRVELRRTARGVM